VVKRLTRQHGTSEPNEKANGSNAEGDKKVAHQLSPSTVINPE